MSARRLLAMLGAATALFAGTAVAQGQDEGSVYQRYANVREHLYSCHVEKAWGTRTPEKNRACRRLQRRYVLYVWPDQTLSYHVHCLTSRCIATPNGEPPADQPMPEGSTVYR